MQILEQYFEALRTQDWQGLAACLADDVHRTGPYLDVIRGKRAYIEFLSEIIPTLRGYDLEVHRIRPLDGGSALVELSEKLDVDGVRTEFPEALLFDFDSGGFILGVNVYIKQPPAPAASNRTGRPPA